MAARGNPVVDTAMTAKDISASLYKVAYGKSPPSIKKVLYSRLGFGSRPHPQGCMCPYHGGHKRASNVPAMRGIGRRSI